MKFKIKSLQEGGQVAPPEAAPAGAQGGAPQEGGGQDPLMQIAEMFATALQSQDCAALAQGAEMFLQLISQAQGAGGGGGEQAPAEQPVYMKKGGKFVLKKKVKNGDPNDPAMAKKGTKMGKKC